ncbi:MAG TPA: hypothetical protein VNV88_11135 [Candidatus Solibacter sp.]|jgi:hypothetical protein|nr:hypothetical protein [Candidatus Solibacter sp.]
MKYFCSRQEQVATELRQGRLPDLWDDALRTHVAGCQFCSDLVLVAQALQQDRMQTVQTAQVVSAGALWWRAQVRLRNGAMERVTRPIALAEKFALIISAAAVLAVIMWKHSQLLGWLLSLADPPHPTALPAGSSLIDGWTTLLMAAGLGTVALCAALAMYLMREEE